MERASEVIKYADLKQLKFNLDYVELLMDAMGKRNLEDPDLESEHKILTKRYTELLNKRK